MKDTVIIFILISIIPLLGGCPLPDNQDNSRPQPGQKLYEYVHDFEDEYQLEEPTDTKVFFGEDDFFKNKSAIGLCFIQQNEIVIRESWWKGENRREVNRQFLMDHELGHCVYGMEHDDEMSESKYVVKDSSIQMCPKSLMHSRFHPDCLVKYMSYYRDEMQEKVDSHPRIHQ